MGRCKHVAFGFRFRQKNRLNRLFIVVVVITVFGRTAQRTTFDATAEIITKIMLPHDFQNLTTAGFLDESF